MDRRVIDLYDEYTHAPLPRRLFIERLARLVGGTAAAFALLPALDTDGARAQTVAPDDPRLVVSWVSYQGVQGEIRAYLAVPTEGPSKRPGVIVVHENRGTNAHIQDVVRRFALAGFTTLGPDLLSPFGGTPADEDAARAMFARIDRATAHQDAVPAIAFLRARPDSNGRIGAVGFCFGGGVVNRMATAAPDLDAAVVFYGQSPPTDDVARIRARMLLHYAGNDANVNAGVPAYEAALKAAAVGYEKYVYPGAEHAFHNDASAARYDKTAADLAWQRTIAFLNSTLRT